MAFFLAFSACQDFASRRKIDDGPITNAYISRTLYHCDRAGSYGEILVWVFWNQFEQQFLACSGRQDSYAGYDIGFDLIENAFTNKKLMIIGTLMDVIPPIVMPNF